MQALLCLALAMGGASGVARDAAGRVTVGVIVNDLGNPFFIALGRAIEDALRAQLGRGVEVELVSSGFDESRQVQQIKKMLDRRVDLLFFTPLDPNGANAALSNAPRRTTTVAAVEAFAREADVVVMTDNIAAGAQACECLLKAIGSRGEIALLDGPKTSAAADRLIGCKRALAVADNVHVVSQGLDAGATREGGIQRATELLQSFPQLKGIFALNDPSAIGAEQAARQADRLDVAIVSVDGSPEMQQRLRDRHGLIVGSSSQSPAILAKRAVSGALEVYRKQRIPGALELVKPQLLTPKNIGSVRRWY